MTEELAKFVRVSITLAGAAILSLVVLAGPGCTITPKLVPPPSIPTSVLVKVDLGYVVTPEEVARYNGLIGLGYGKPDHGFLPALRKNDGVIVRPDGSLFLDDQHMRDFAKMNDIYRSKIKP